MSHKRRNKEKIGRWKIRSSERLYHADRPYPLDLIMHHVEMPDRNLMSYTFTEFKLELVYVVAIDDLKRVVLVKQYRHPIRKIVIELPGGIRENNESVKNCAKRELLEETGYRARVIRKLLSFYHSPGQSNLAGHIYIATQLTKAEQKLAPGEFIQTLLLPLQKAVELVINGKIFDGPTCLGILVTALIFQTKLPHFNIKR